MAREEKNELKRLSRLLSWLMSSPHLKFSTLDSSPASHVLHYKRAFQGSAPWTAPQGSVRCPQRASCQGAVRGAESPVRRKKRRRWPDAEEDPAGSAMFCLLAKYLIGCDVDRRRIPCFLIYSQYVYALYALFPFVLVVILHLLPGKQSVCDTISLCADLFFNTQSIFVYFLETQMTQVVLEGGFHTYFFLHPPMHLH